MLTEIISLCFASYFFNGCASGKNMNASLKKKRLSGSLKIGYVNIDNLINETKIGINTLETLEGYRLTKEEILQQKLSEFEIMQSKLKDQMALHNEELKTRKKQNLEALETEIQELQQRFQTELLIKEQKEMNNLMNKIQKGIDKYALVNEYDYILTLPSIAYADEYQKNITEDIKNILNNPV